MESFGYKSPGVRLLTLGAFCLLLLAPAVHATQVISKNWNTQTGLPQNSVHGIAQTPDGYIWLATNDGLARFDGVRFKVFKRSDLPQLPTNRLNGVFADAGGRLWIISEILDKLVVLEKGRFSVLEKGTHFDAYIAHRISNSQREVVFQKGNSTFFYQDSKRVISLPMSSLHRWLRGRAA